MRWDWTFTRVTSLTLLVFFVVSMLGCALVEGFNASQSKEIKEKLAAAQADLEKVRDRAGSLKKLYEDAKEKGVGDAFLGELRAQAEDAWEEYKDIKHSFGEFKDEAEKQLAELEDQGLLAQLGFWGGVVGNIALAYVTGGRGKAIASLIGTIEAFNLSKDDKKVLEAKQRKAGVHGIIARSIAKIDKKNGKAS